MCVSSVGRSGTYVRGGEEAFGATLVGLSETAQLPQTQGLAVKRPAAALAHAQRCVAVLYAAFILPLRDRDIESVEGKDKMADYVTINTSVKMRKKKKRKSLNLLENNL